MRGLIAIAICVAVPGLAAAQTSGAALAANDVTFALGWSGAEHNIYDIHDSRRWHASLLAGISGGHYWTDYIKTEVDLSWANPRDREIYETLERQGGFTYALSNYRAHDVRLGVVQLFQFGRNDWVHPYVGLGVDMVRRQATLTRDRQSRVIYLQNRSVPIDISASSERKTTTFAEAVIKTGLKMYATERIFFNTELKLGARSDIDHVAWKFGVGFDF
jgi:hypothetical protein